MKSYKKTVVGLVAAVFTLGLVLTGCGGAKQEAKPAVQYPTKPVQVIVPAGAGGDTDTNARLMGKYLEKELGKPVVIVNAGGAGGTQGTRKVVKESQPDGYTVLFHHPSFPLQRAVGFTDYSFDDAEIANVALLDDTNVFVVNAESKFKTMKDVVDASKADPKSVKFATEIGNFTHIQVLAVEQKAGIQLNVVDVGSAAAKTAALMGNQIDIIGTQYGLVKQFIDAGKFRAIGVLSEKRNPLMPDVPTFKEQGIDVSFSKYFFYAFPKGTPKEIVDKFNAAVEKVCKNPEFIKEMEKFLVVPNYMPTTKAVEYLKKDEAVLKGLVDKAGLANSAKK